MDTILSESVGFNRAEPTIMLLDINSCFATIEQQANPLLRGKPVAVGAYKTPNGCILAASREAKQNGVKTGMRIKDGKMLCPNLVVVAPDSDKYRYVHKKLVAILSLYTPKVEVKSIDEMIVSFQNTYILEKRKKNGVSCYNAMISIASEIKKNIKEQIGDWITVSVGIAPNRYLAKVASGRKKPDGLVVINKDSIMDILKTMQLEDLTGIKTGNATRLRASGIATPVAFYCADMQTLKRAFASITGYYWWLRLHGFEADDREFGKRSVGHQHALKQALPVRSEALKTVVYQLIMKMGRRLRYDRLTARGVHVWCQFSNFTSWGIGETQKTRLFADSDFYEAACRLLKKAPEGQVRLVSVSCFDLSENLYTQQSLFSCLQKKEYIARARDAVCDKFGEGTVVPGRLLFMDQKVHDRIGFGGGSSIDFATRGISV